jgi:hypothetical protein
MRATLYGGPGGISVGERPDPVAEAPTEAVDGILRPGRVSYDGTDLDGVHDAYVAMDETHAITSLLALGPAS